MCRIVLRFALLAVSLMQGVNAAERDDFVPMRTVLNTADLDRLETELADPAKRLPAIAALADFAWMHLYRIGSMSIFSGDPARDALSERAAILAQRHIDIDTVSRALDSDDPRLHMWGLWFWRRGAYNAICAAGRSPIALPTEGRTADESAWHALMPKIRRLAKDSPYRVQAIEGLGFFCFAENQEFLSRLIPEETSASVILRLCDATTVRRTNESRDARFNQELLRLLASPDAKVRQGALADIAFNSTRAEMWQVRFSTAVEQRVAELRKSDDGEDRRLADWAVKDMAKMGPTWQERDHAKEPH